MPILDEIHFEAGEEDPLFMSSGESNPPVSDAVSATDAIDGGYSKRIVFGSGDNWGHVRGGAYNRAATLDPMLWGFWVWCDAWADLDEASFWLSVPTSSQTAEIGFSVNVFSGVITARCGNSTGASFNANASLGASGGGNFPDSTPVFVSIRVILGDGTDGEFVVDVNGTNVLNLVGIDTNRVIGTPNQTGWGPNVYLSSRSGGTPVFIFDNLIFGQAEASPIRPRRFEVLLPNGVTADNDGTIIGAELTADAALAKIPASAADGITLDLVNDIQGLTFPSRVGTGTIRTVRGWGAVGDSASGSEQLRANLNDGTTEDTGDNLVLTSAFDAQPLTEIFEVTPTGGAWDDTALDSTHLELERTA